MHVAQSTNFSLFTVIKKKSGFLYIVMNLGYFRISSFMYLSISNTHSGNFAQVVLRLSPCLVCSLCSFGNFPGVGLHLLTCPPRWLAPLSPLLYITYLASTHFIPDRPGRWNRHWVPKRRLLTFRRRGNSQKNTDCILNTAKVLKPPRILMMIKDWSVVQQDAETINAMRLKLRD